MNELCDDLKGYMLGFLSPRSAASAALAHRGLRMREEDARLAAAHRPSCQMHPLFFMAAYRAMRLPPALRLAIASGQDTASAQQHSFTPACTWAALAHALAHPPRILAVVQVAQVSTHGRRLIMRTHTGCAYSMGTGVHGQLGLGPGITHAAAPTRIAAMRQPVTRVATCETHSAFVCADGSLYTCGLDEDGQLGQGHAYPPTFNFDFDHNVDDDEDIIYPQHDNEGGDDDDDDDEYDGNYDDDNVSNDTNNSDDWIVDDEKVHMTPEPARVTRLGTDRRRDMPVIFMDVAINRSFTVALAADGQVYMCGFVPVAAQHATWTRLRAHPRFRALSKRAVCVRAFSSTNDFEFDDVAVLTVNNAVYSTSNARLRENGDTVGAHPRLDALGQTWGTGVVGSLVVPVNMSRPRLSVLQRALGRTERFTDFSLVSREER